MPDHVSEPSGSSGSERPDLFDILLQQDAPYGTHSASAGFAPPDDAAGNRAPRLQLTPDRRRPAGAVHPDAEHGVTIAAPLRESLDRLARCEGVALPLIVLGAFQVLLHRYSGEDVFVIGAPVDPQGAHQAGQGSADMPSLVALHVNLSQAPAFRVVLARVRAGVTEARTRHAAVSGDAGGHTGVMARTAENAFPIVFSLAPGRQEGRQVGRRGNGSPTAAAGRQDCELELELAHADAELVCRFKYSSRLFEAETLARMARHFETLLEQIAARPEQAISRLEILSEPERRQLLDEWSGMRAGMPERCIHELFEACARQAPDDVAVVFEGRETRYAELSRQSNRLGQALIEAGHESGRPVAIMLHDGPHALAAMLAVLKCAAPFVYFDATYPTNRLTAIAEEVEPAFLIADRASMAQHKALADSLAETGAQVLLLEPASGEGQADAARLGSDDSKPLDTWPDAEPGRAVHPSGPAYIVYTSGSSGRPKGIVQSHRSFCQYIDWQSRQFGITAPRRMAHWASLAYDAAYREVFGSLCFGATLCMAPPSVRYNPRSLVAWAREARISIFNVVPSFWRQVVEVLRSEPHAGDGHPLPDLEVLLHPGEVLPVDLAQSWLSDFPDPPRLFNLYGPSECVLATVYPVERVSPEQRSIPVGRAIEGRQILILDKHQELCPLGVPGEIYVRSRHLTLGYHRRPEETAARFIQNPLHDGQPDTVYRTGDIGRWLPDGTVEFLGRADNLVKLNGIRVELGEIETVLRRHDGVRDCAVVVRTQQAKQESLVALDRGTRSQNREAPAQKILVAYYTSDLATRAADLRGFLEANLPVHMVPQHFVRLEALPLNRNRKLDRGALPEPESVRSDLLSEYVSPRTETEARLARIWQEVLGVEKVGVDDGFLELGGNSLLAIQALNRVRQVMNATLSFRELYTEQTVAKVARLIDDRRDEPQTTDTANTRRERPERLPLTRSQEGLWYLWRLEPDNPYYTGQGSIRLRGSLDVAVLIRAWKVLLDRHEVLRARFGTEADRPVQWFLPVSEFDLPVVDLTDLPADERRTEIDRSARIRAARAFDLEKDQLLEATLYKVCEDEHEIQITFHEIIADLWGLSIVFRDLGRLYEGMMAGREPPLSPLTFNYGDYALWEAEHIRRDKLTAQGAYWQEQLSGDLPTMDLPTDYARPAVLSYKGASRSVLLERKLSQRLGEIARAHDATLFMILLAAVAVHLRVYSGRKDLIIGSPFSSRPHEKSAELAGFFVNMLPLRFGLADDPSFADLLGQVRERVTDGLSNAAFPFAWMLESVQAVRDLSLAPVFQVMFNMINFHHTTETYAGVEISYDELDTGYTKYDLTFYAQEVGERIYLSIAYQSELFAQRTIEGMLDNVVALLESIAEDPRARLSELKTLHEAERTKLLVDFNATAHDLGTGSTIHELFEEQVEKTPDRTAYIFEDRRLSYAELNARANQVAHFLRKAGVGPAGRVGICVERSLDMVVALLGIVKSGAAYVPLDTTYPTRRLEEILEDAKPSVLVLQKDLDRFAAFAGRKVHIDSDRDLIGQEESENPTPLRGPGRLLNIIYTSSTTGRPKGVLVEEAAVLNRLAWMWQDYPFVAGDLALLHKSYGLVAATWELFGALLKGVPTLILSYEDVLDPALLWRKAAGHGVSHLLATPPLLEGVLTQAGLHPGGWPSLRLATTSAEPISPAMVERWRRAFPGVPLLNLYGSTECSSNATVYDAARLPPDAARVPIGRPLPNVRAYVLDDRLNPVPIGAVGELCIAGACLARGYLGLPEPTGDRFVADPFSHEPGARLYRSGDLARFGVDGNLELVGRNDNQVTLRGFRVELEELEAAAIAHPRVHRCAAVATGEGTRRRLALFAVPEGEVAPAEIREHMAERLPNYMVPADVVVTESLPLTPNGKVDRAALSVMARERTAATRRRRAPRGQTEKRLARIWSELLELDEFDVQDNFFDLGGHSLLAVRMFSQIRAEFGADLPLATLYRAATVEDLARVLDKPGEDVSWPILVTVQGGGSKPPLFCVHGIFGEVLFYRELASSLGSDHPIYGLQPPTLNGRAMAQQSIEELAALYVDEIRKAQPQGPYHVGGYSFGGVVALEIASQLRARRQEVALVAVFDSLISPELGGTFQHGEGSEDQPTPTSRIQKRLREWRHSLREVYVLWKIYMQLMRARSAACALLYRMYLHLERPIPITLRSDYTRRCLRAMHKRYEPKPHPGRITLFCTQYRRQKAVEGWSEYAERGLDVHRVPGKHGNIFEQPHVQDLAAELRPYLQGATLRTAAE